MHCFSIGLWCAMKSGFHTMTSDNQLMVGWRRSPKYFLKLNLYQKKVMVIVWWFAACVICYSFLNPDDMITSEKYAQQIHKTHWKLQHLQLALINRKSPVLHTMPDHISHNQAFKSWMNWATSFASFSIFTWPLTNWLPLLQASQLFEWKCFHNQQEAETAFEKLVESRSMDFYARGINKLISHWQKCADFNGSHFD